MEQGQKVGKALNSPSLMADAKHMRADMFDNAVVLAGLCSNLTRLDLERMAAFVIVIFIAATGGKILIDGIRVLLDASLDYKTLSLAEKLILSEPQVIKIKSLTGRNSGRYKFIEAEKAALERLGIRYESGDLKNQLKPALAYTNEHDQVARSGEHRADGAQNR